MTRKTWLGVEEARSKLPHLLDQAASGSATVITRHGRPVAALVPLESYGAGIRQHSIVPLAGTGRGLWGKRSTTKITALRDEWTR
jgi:prevent-host-death family protein